MLVIRFFNPTYDAVYLLCQLPDKTCYGWRVEREIQALMQVGIPYELFNLSNSLSWLWRNVHKAKLGKKRSDFPPCELSLWLKSRLSWCICFARCT